MDNNGDAVAYEEERRSKVIKSDCNAWKVKLPELVMTRFNDAHINWFRFWYPFESEIDRSELSGFSTRVASQCYT